VDSNPQESVSPILPLVFLISIYFHPLLDLFTPWMDSNISWNHWMS
jgi:hypothetical protein